MGVSIPVAKSPSGPTNPFIEEVQDSQTWEVGGRKGGLWKVYPASSFPCVGRSSCSLLGQSRRLGVQRNARGWLRRLRRRRLRRYDVFISYSHGIDRGLAPAIQHGLQQLAKPWYQRHALHVFRDETDLGASPGLWPAIRSALVRSRHLVLLMSPEAASSPWVRRELKLWLRLNGTRGLYFVLTSGAHPIWRQDVAVETATDPVPAILKGLYRDDPDWVDWRDIRSNSEFRRDNDRCQHG
jgi:hypothetical protein